MDNRWLVFSNLCSAPAAAVLSCLALSSFAAEGPAAGPIGKNSAVSLEKMAGGHLKRVTLSAAAAERLGIQTGSIGEQVVTRRQTVGGMVIYPQAAPASTSPAAIPAAAPAATPAMLAAAPGFGTYAGLAATRPPAAPAEPMIRPVTTLDRPASPGALAAAESRVVLSLSAGEYERLDKTKPARILPLYARDKGMKEMLAVLAAEPPVSDAKRSMLGLQYMLPSSEHGLAPSTRVRVELPITGSDAPQKVAPYNALYYDATGASWVYVMTRPLTYERQRVVVQRVIGDLAVLAEGPPVGTSVVTTGAALLYGAEIFGK